MAETSISAAEREDLEHRTALALTAEVYPVTVDDDAQRAINYDKVRAHLITYRDETLQGFTSSPFSQSCNDLGLMFCTGLGNEELLNDWITTQPDASSKGIDGTVSFIEGLHKYENIETQQNGYCSPRRIQQISAILTATDHIGKITRGQGTILAETKHGSLAEYIKDDQIRELLTTHENPTAVADIITQRNLIDATQITALIGTMSNTASVINNGTL